MMVEATARKCDLPAQRVRVCALMRNQASWVNALALSVWPACSLWMWPRATRCKSSYSQSNSALPTDGACAPVSGASAFSQAVMSCVSVRMGCLSGTESGIRKVQRLAWGGKFCR